jgi:hypothetical protein
VRKRVVIAALAVLVIGVGAFVLSQPKKGSLEWHKQEYQDARMRLNRYTFADRARRVWARIMGKPVLPLVEEVKLRQKVIDHEAALLEIGFLAKRELSVEGRSSGVALWQTKSKELVTGYARWRVTGMHSENVTQRGNVIYVIEVVAPTNDFSKWEEYFQKRVAP